MEGMGMNGTEMNGSRMDDNGRDYKKLTRSRRARMLCGVCGGIGEYLNLDPTVVRLLWILFVFFSFGMAVLIYFIAAVVMPDEE